MGDAVASLLGKVREEQERAPYEALVTVVVVLAQEMAIDERLRGSVPCPVDERSGREVTLLSRGAVEVPMERVAALVHDGIERRVEEAADAVDDLGRQARAGHRDACRRLPDREDFSPRSSLV